MSKKLELKLLLDMVDKVTGPLKKIREASGGVSGELKATRDKLKELNKQSAQIDGYKKVSRSLSITSQDLVKAQKKMQLLDEQMKQSQNPSKALRKEHEQSIQTLRNLKGARSKLVASHKQMREELRLSGIDTRKLGDTQKELKEKIQQTTDVMELQRKKLEAVSRKQKQLNDAGASYQKAKALQSDLAGKGAGMVATGAAVGAASAIPIIEYSKAETAATGLKVSMMGAGGVVRKEFAEINALATQLGNKLPGTTADFQDMMTTLIQQGMSSKAILGGLGEATAFLGVQMKLPFNEAAEFAAKLQDATGTAEKDMMSLMDVIHRSYYLGVDKTNMLQGFSKLSSALPVLRKQGLEAAKLLSPLIVMADQAGMAGEASGNAYRKAFQLSMDAGKVGKANNILADMGIKLDFTDGKGEFAGLENMFSQLQKLGGLNTETRLSVLKQIYGDDAETLQVMNIMITKGIAGYREAAAKMEAQASLQLRVNEQLNTLTNLWDAATGTFTNALVNVGEAVAPELKQLVNWLSEMAEKLGTWIKANPELTGTLFKVAMGVGALAVAGGTLTLMLAGILGPIALLKYSTSVLGINLMSAVAPTGLLTTAFGGLSKGVTGIISKATNFKGAWAGIGALWKQSDPKTLLISMGKGGGIVDRFKASFASLRGTLSTLIPRLTFMSGATMALMKSQMLAVVSGAKLAAVNAGKAIKSTASGIQSSAAAMRTYVQAHGPLGTLWNGFIASAKGIGRVLISSVMSPLRLVGQTLLFVGRAALLNPIGLLVTAIGLGALAVYKYWQPIKAFFVGFWQGLQEGLAPVAEALSPAFVAFGSALAPLKPIWDGIASAMGTVWKWVTDLLTPINSTAAELDNATNAGKRFGLWLADLINIIPRLAGDFVGFGANLMEGFSKGIMSMGHLIKESLGSTISEGVDYFKNLLGIASPSKVFAVMGDQTMQGLTVGINRSQQAPLNEVGKLGKQMAGAAFVLGVTALPAAAITDQTRIIRDEYQSADYSVPDAIRLVKEGELPARKPKSDNLSPDDNGLTHSAAPDRLGTFAQRQAPQPQTVHIDAGIHAPITVYATANMNAQDVAQLIAIELEKRERAQQARLRSSLKDLN
ncbi:phage tail tape measure protein [Shewanella sp.]|uniref:phage tail tape measure protein n=1 Tax=Shewanella sp. TaxID=50422 RepID=UPI003A85A6B0